MESPAAVGVDTSVQKGHVSVHQGDISAYGEVLERLCAELCLKSCGHTLLRISESVDYGSSRGLLYSLDGVLENLVVRPDGEHVPVVSGEELVFEVEVVVVAVGQLVVTAYLRTSVGLLVEERGHLDE